MDRTSGIREIGHAVRADTHGTLCRHAWDTDTHGTPGELIALVDLSAIYITYQDMKPIWIYAKG